MVQENDSNGDFIAPIVDSGRSVAEQISDDNFRSESVHSGSLNCPD